MNKIQNEEHKVSINDVDGHSQNKNVDAFCGQ